VSGNRRTDIFGRFGRKLAAVGFSSRFSAGQPCQANTNRLLLRPDWADANG